MGGCKYFHTKRKIYRPITLIHEKTDVQAACCFLTIDASSLRYGHIKHTNGISHLNIDYQKVCLHENVYSD